MGSNWYSTNQLIKQYRTNLKASDPERLKQFIQINGFDQVALARDGAALKWIFENGRMPRGRVYIEQDPVPYQDHARLFKNTQTGLICLVFHPYRDPDQIGPELEGWAEKHGLVADIYGREYSWYYPGRTALVVISLPGVLVNVQRSGINKVEPCCLLNAKGECKALTVKEKGCLSGKCPFHKTAAEQEQSLDVAKERCRRLGIPFGKDYRGPMIF